VAFRWICAISDELESTQDEGSWAGLRRRLCMLAATCFSTYDVCPEHVSALLADEEDFSIAMRCAIVVHNNTPSSLSDANSYHLARILSRHRRLLYDLEPIFRESSPNDLGQVRLSHSGAYNLALAWLGLSYRNCSNWHALSRPDSQWISCVTERGQKVHYDLLTGQLLIDGKQMGKLPREILKHPTYMSLLGTVSGQLAHHFRLAEVFSESFRCSSGRYSRSGLYDSIRRVRISGRATTLVGRPTIIMIETHQRSYFRGTTEI
jgi:hypothetical protein